MSFKEETRQAAEAAWAQISITNMDDNALQMFEAGARHELQKQTASEYCGHRKRTPKEIHQELFKDVPLEEYGEKLRLLEELMAGCTLEMLHYKTELYKRNTREVEDFKRRYEEDMKKKVAKARAEAIGVLDAVAAMLNNSDGGTHRMKEFYARSMIRFIKDAKVNLEAEFSTDDLPF